MNKIIAYATLLRIPGLGGLGIPPVVAALSVGVNDFYSLFLLFIIGSLTAVFGFVLNDYSDVELDRLVSVLRKKPLVSGIISKKTAVLISFLTVIFTFFFIFILWNQTVIDNYKLYAVFSIVTAGILGTIYNLYGKKFVGSDFLVAISMSLVFLVGALSFGPPNVITWILFILTFNQTLHMNAVEGGIKDADHDFKRGVKNIALTSGIKVVGYRIFIPNSFKAFGMGIRFFSAFLVFIPFIIFNYPYHYIQILLLVIATATILFISAKLINIKGFNRDKIRKYIGFQCFLRYSIVPIMLISIIDIWWYSIVLIMFPIIWYIVFTIIIGEQLFKPRM